MSKRNRKDAGPQNLSEPAFLIVGKLRRAHGVKGEIPLEVYTDMPEILTPGSVVYVGNQHSPYTIEETRWKQELLLLKFKEISDRTVVSKLTNNAVYILESQLPPLEEGQYYDHDLIGIDVFLDNGDFAGVLEEILVTGANDVYSLRDPDGKELLIPAIDDMILEIDLEMKKMIIKKMEWYGEGN